MGWLGWVGLGLASLSKLIRGNSYDEFFLMTELFKAFYSASHFSLDVRPVHNKDKIDQMIVISELPSTYVRNDRVIWDFLIWIN
jgi:hypothetical protein